MIDNIMIVFPILILSKLGNLMKESALKAVAAELIGTFILVFFGCGSIIVDQANDGLFGLQGIALAFGLIVMAIIYALGHVSGAHINPAVTVSLAATGKFSWDRVLAYILAQVSGAILAALALKFSLANGDTLGMTLPSGSLGQAFFLEVVLTALLMFVVMGIGVDVRAPSQFSGIAIASVIIVDVLVGGAVTGASMNPARSFGPALIEMNFDHIWLYLTAPFIGGLIGAFGYQWCAAVKS